MSKAATPPLAERPLADLSPGERVRLRAVADALASGLTLSAICGELGLYQAAQEPDDSLKKWLYARRSAWQEARATADTTRTQERVARLYEVLDALIHPPADAEAPSPEVRVRAVDVQLRDIRKGEEIAQRREAQRLEVTGAGGGPVQTEVSLGGCTDEQIAAAASALGLTG